MTNKTIVSTCFYSDSFGHSTWSGYTQTGHTFFYFAGNTWNRAPITTLQNSFLDFIIIWIKFLYIISLNYPLFGKLPLRLRNTSVFSGLGNFTIWFSLAGLVCPWSSGSTISTLDLCSEFGTFTWSFVCGLAILKLSIALSKLLSICYCVSLKL